MGTPLVECIPNFSEGRREGVIEAIADAIQSFRGVQVLDQHSDEDHNRTVFTLLGSPDAVSDAAFRGIRKAAELIDMNEHRGEHPRIGAADVVPFVPIRDFSMAECISLAKNLGKKVAEELGIPVFLYEEAAVRPERVNLENIRRGEYEALKEEIKTNPGREPDYGPAELGSAGAVVIGAREPLVAFNVYLSTDDVATAKKIARAVRHSSGGLRYVKAMGVQVEGRAQVSMNLTNYHKTPIAMVVETIRREAARYGTAIHHSELVGLIPQEALIDAAVWYAQLDQFESDQVLEYRLEQADGGAGKYDFLDELASGEPTPGGGSAAAFTAAQAAALTEMVARITLGSKKYADIHPDMEDIVVKAENLRQDLTGAVERDAEAFESLMDAYRLPKSSEQEKSERKEAIRIASFFAAEIPLLTAEKAVDVMRLALDTALKGNLNAVTDAWTASALARAAVTAGGANVRVNLKGMEDDAGAKKVLQALDRAEKEAAELYKEIRDVIGNRSGISML